MKSEDAKVNAGSTLKVGDEVVHEDARVSGKILKLEERAGKPCALVEGVANWSPVAAWRKKKK